MSPFLVFGVITCYFVFLLLIAFFTSRNANNETFFIGNRKSPWYIVAFAMIGSSISGVTFISIPGEVGSLISAGEPQYKAFSYFQLVLGYLLGYFVIANVLMPLYYRLKLISIYTYLKERFGLVSYKTGSMIFLVSQTIGASLRLYIAANVLQIAFFDAFGIPFIITVMISILLIWLYTNKGGLKTVVWSDTFQTAIFLAAVIFTILFIGKELNMSVSNIIQSVHHHPYSNVFFWDWKSSKFFFKQFFSGAFIAIVMTGLDQNMMQKNLSCKNIRDAKKNMYWFSLTLVPVNLLFLSLGVLLYMYSAEKGISIPALSDDLYPQLAIHYFPVAAGIIFLLGIIAAAYSSADSALTALTTAFCIDFLNFGNRTEESGKKIRKKVHLGFSFLIMVVIYIFSLLNNDSVINAVFKMAGYTYGPLLGIFAFGLFTRYQIRDRLLPLIAVLSPLICFFIDLFSEKIIPGFKFGFSLLIVNGILTFIGLLLICKKNSGDREVT